MQTLQNVLVMLIVRHYAQMTFLVQLVCLAYTWRIGIVAIALDVVVVTAKIAITIWKLVYLVLKYLRLMEKPARTVVVSVQSQMSSNVLLNGVSGDFVKELVVKLVHDTVLGKFCNNQYRKAPQHLAG